MRAKTKVILNTERVRLIRFYLAHPQQNTLFVLYLKILFSIQSCLLHQSCYEIDKKIKKECVCFYVKPNGLQILLLSHQGVGLGAPSLRFSTSLFPRNMNKNDEIILHLTDKNVSKK